MRKCSLTLVGAFLLLLAVFLTFKGFVKEPQTKPTNSEYKQIIPTTVYARANQSSVQKKETIVVEYSTHASFLRPEEQSQ
jgi:hypothetical protein